MTTPIVLYIIDDDRDDQNLLIEILREIDPTIEYYTATNGQEGLKKLDSNSIPIPSVIFLDLNMPRIDGRQFLSEIKKRESYKFIPLIIYTTSSNQKDIDELTQLGAAGYLVKQFDIKLLKKELNDLLSTLPQSNFNQEI